MAANQSVRMTATVPNSAGTGFYRLEQHNDDSWSCECKAWKNQHAEPSLRRCKHMDALTFDLGRHVVGVYNAAKAAVGAATG